MNNFQVVIDAGHGGDDIGCLLYNIPEKSMTLEISKYMYQKLKSMNISVSYVRVDDETISSQKRIQKIKEIYGDHKQVIVISNHMSNKEEYEIVYGLKNNPQLSYSIVSSLLQETKKVVCYSKRWGLKSNLDYYKIHREIANMQVLRIYHPYQQNRSYLDKGVDAIVSGICRFIGITDNTNWYEIAKGDTLWSVAKKFQLGVETLKELNGLSSNNLHVGDRLKVKTETKEICYTVSLGENLYQISQKFQVDIEDLMVYNHKKSNLVSVGETIYIPKKDNINHIVQKGENLYQIANQYRIEVEDLVCQNDLIGLQVKNGDVLKIEKTS